MQKQFTQDDPQYHQDVLSSLAAADLMLAHTAALDINAPHLMEHVTLAWLQEVFTAQGITARLLDMISVDKHEGMTTRNKWRLVWDKAGSTPETIFIKATPPEGYLRETLSLLHMHDLEARFYQTLQPENSALAPRAYHAKSYVGGRFLIVLEDLDSLGCKPYWQADKCDETHARAVIEALANFHAKYWQSDRLLTDLSWVRPRTRRYGWEWLCSSFTEARNKFLSISDPLVLPDNVRDLLLLWDANAEVVFEYWESQPKTLLHGDSHLGNTFSYADGRAGLFDWQVMFAGHGLRDVAYFLLSALNNEDRQLHERALVNHYVDTLAEHGIKLDAEAAWNDYCLFVLDRWDASIKSYLGNYGHAKDAQIRSLQSTVGSLIENDVLGRLKHLLATLN